MSAKSIAKAIILLGGDKFYISNLKLNKLLYLAYAHNLHNGRKVFNDSIEAWKYGPVVPSVYNEYKSYGRRPICLNGTASKENQLIAKEILNFYGEYTAFDLVDYLHREKGAWHQARMNNEQVITDERILASKDGVFEDFEPQETLADAAKKGDIRWVNVYKNLENK